MRLDVVDPEDRRATTDRLDPGDDGLDQPVPRIGPPGDGPEEALPARPGEHESAASPELVDPAEDLEVLLDRLAETEARIDHDRVGSDPGGLRRDGPPLEEGLDLVDHVLVGRRPGVSIAVDVLVGRPQAMHEDDPDPEPSREIEHRVVLESRRDVVDRVGPGLDRRLGDGRPGRVDRDRDPGGPGVPPERAEELFSGPQSTRTGGAGVGLPHSHSLAERKGGDLSLVERELGNGARFELRWPEAEVRSAARQRSMPPPTTLAGKRILVLEDDAAVVSLLELALESRGMEVVVARSAAELTHAACGVFDAALVDLSPIEANAPQALATLRQHNQGLPVIVISGSAYGIPDKLRADVTAWVRKPFEVSEVVDALARIA